MATLRYDRLPPHLRGAVYRYVEFGVLPGDFLTAVLSNDLREACARADDINRYLLFDIVSWLYNDAPLLCWGNSANIRDWLKCQAASRRTATPEELARYGDS